MNTSIEEKAAPAFCEGVFKFSAFSHAFPFRISMRAGNFLPAGIKKQVERD